MKRDALGNYFKTTSTMYVTNVEPKNEHAGIGENLIADDSSSSSTLVLQEAKDLSTTYLDIGIVSAEIFQKR